MGCARLVQRVAATLVGAALLACSGGPVAADRPIAEVQQVERLPIAVLRHLAARGQWQRVLDQVDAAVPGDGAESAAVYRARALWALGRRAPALAAEDALLARPQANEAAVLALVRLHWRGYQDAAAAWRLLRPLVSKGCASTATCTLAVPILSKLTALPDWAGAVRAAAPPVDRGPARWSWYTALAAAGSTATGELLWTLLHDEARTTIAPRPAWLALHGLASRWLGGAAGRTRWGDAVTAPETSPALLVELATAPEVAADRGLSVRLLQAAAARPAAPPATWSWLAWALARTDDRVTLTALAQADAARFASAEERLALARALLQVRATGQAESWLALAGEPEDAVAVAIAAEIARIKGAPAGDHRDRLLGGRVRGDISLGALVLGQFLRRADPVAADRLLAVAAATPGRGQLVAAWLRAMPQFGAGRRAATMDAAKVYLDLLAESAALQPGPFGDDPPLDPADAREKLARLDSGNQERALVATAVARWAEAGVAAPGDLRRLATRQAAAGQGDRALASDALARAAGDQGLVEPGGRPELLAQLGGQGAQLLARWWADAQPRDWDNRREPWVVADKLFRGQFAALGQFVAQAALVAFPSDDLGPRDFEEALGWGAADLVVDRLAARAFASAGQAMAEGPLLVRARLELGQPAQAERDAVALAELVPQNARAQKALFEVVASHGMCGPVLRMAPRLAADPDLYLYRTAVTRGLDCARRMQDEAAALAIVKAGFGARIDPARLEVLVTQLAMAGFERMAIDVARQLQQVRPVGEDVGLAWARAHLALGQTIEASELLQSVAGLNPRAARIWLRAAELLDDYGQLEAALAFYRGAAAADPDSTRLQVRVIVTLLRLDRRADAAEALTTLARQGGSESDYEIVLELSRRTHATKTLYDAVMSIADADRELERFRAELAAELGDRPGVTAAVRRLRAKGGAVGADGVAWLQRVGQWSQARELAEDALASTEPVGGQGDGERMLGAALSVQRDPGSAEEAVGLARLAIARATHPELTTALAAQELGRHHMPAEGLALARRFAVGTDLTYLTLRASLAYKSGNRAEAHEVWQQVQGALLVDTQLRDLLRALDPVVRSRQKAPIDALLWMTNDMEAAAAASQLDDLLGALRQAAPDSPWLAYQTLQHAVRNGLTDRAATALRAAYGGLREWSSALEGAIDRLARDVGEASLREASGLAVAASEPLEPALARIRTPPWWLGKALATLPGVRPPHPEVAAAVRQLAEASPLLRAEWATQLAAAGQAEQAAALLGSHPLAVQEGNAPVAVRAMAVTLAALHGPKQAGSASANPAAADRWLHQWLTAHPNVDAGVLLGAELVRQGHPDLARAALAKVPMRFGGTNSDLLQRRMLALAGFASGGEVVDAATTYLRGNRSQLATRQQGDAVQSPSDDVFALLVSAGRLDAAQQLADTLRRTEPGVAVPRGLLAASGTSPLRARIDAWRSSAVDDLLASRSQVSVEVVEAALPLAVAASPTQAVLLAETAVARGAEPWRAWAGLARTALDFGEVALAAEALARSLRSPHAPTLGLACLRAAVRPDPSIAACTRGRTLDAMGPDDQADVALWLARSATSSEHDALLEVFAQSTTAAQVTFVGAAGSRRAAMAPTERQRFSAWLRAAIAGLGPARSDGLVLTSLEDLGAFDLADLGVVVTRAALRNNPNGHGHHNNLAYALYLSGRPIAEALQHALWAERGSAGDFAAAAALDTLAAVRFAAGDVRGALDTQRRALAATVAPSVQLRTPPSLSLARLAEFLLATGDLAGAHRLAAVAMGRGIGDPSSRDEWSAQPRLRQVLRATLRPHAQGVVR
ncbi:MAG: hypothetical protein FJ100_11510 [Deltaproteobacteria bacterium]|nr:hypothetical protein [Deltaproteobacteria bacterium]